MKLVIYNRENCRVMSEERVGKKSIRFSRDTGSIYLSTKLTKDLNIKSGDRLELANDESNAKEWYLRKTTEEQGFPLQINKSGSRIISKFVCKTVLNTVKIKESATFLVSKEPVKTEQGTFYKIILSCPIFSKHKPSTNKA